MFARGYGVFNAAQVDGYEAPALPVLRRYFGEVRPAATMIAAGLSDARMKIEVEVTAHRAGKMTA